MSLNNAGKRWQRHALLAAGAKAVWICEEAFGLLLAGYFSCSCFGKHVENELHVSHVDTKIFL